MTRRPTRRDIAVLTLPQSQRVHPAGTCAICRERDEARHHGAAYCRGNFRRQHPTCTWDGKRPRFALDRAALDAIGG